MKAASARLVAVLLAARVAVSGAAGLESEGKDASTLEARVDRIFAAVDSTDSAGCSLGVMRDGELVYEHGYGMADLEHHVAITPATVFYLASVSKQFTAAAIAILVQQGRLSEQDSVRKYVPELPAYAQRITLQHLIHHTSGIRDYLTLWELSGHGYEDSLSERAALALIARQRAANFEPGSQYSYSNSGYFLLALIVRRVSGQSLREFAQQHLFAPLGMRHTQFFDDPTRIVPDRALGYFHRPDGTLAYRRTTFALVGDGGLLTSIEDLARWDRHFYENPAAAGGPALVQRQLSVQPLNSGAENHYAYGLTLGRYRGLPTVEHNGSFIGFNTSMVRFPSSISA